METPNLYKKILAVMGDVEYLQKDDDVKAGGTTYRAITEEKVTSAVGAAMRKRGLVIYPIDIVERREDMEVKRRDGSVALDRLATVMVRYRIADVDSGEHDTIVSVGTGVDTQDKAVGKAQTYAYKYALLRTFSIPTGEDPDRVASDQVAPHRPAPAPAAKGKPQQPRAPEAPPPSGKITDDEYRHIIQAAVEEYGKDVAMGIIKDQMGKMGIATLRDLKQSDYQWFLAAVAGTGDQQSLPWG